MFVKLKQKQYTLSISSRSVTVCEWIRR